MTAPQPPAPEHTERGDSFKRLLRHALAQTPGVAIMAAGFEYEKSHSVSAALRMAAECALAGTVFMVALLGFGRAFGLRTEEEWARTATPAQRREHRIAVAYGLVMLAVAFGALYFL